MEDGSMGVINLFRLHRDELWSVPFIRVVEGAMMRLKKVEGCDCAEAVVKVD